MSRAENEVREHVDRAFPGSWHVVPQVGADPHRWVNENGESLVRANIALREALLGLAREVDDLRSRIDEPKSGGTAQ